MSTERTELDTARLHKRLRDNVAGHRAQEAAVELLIRAWQGRFAGTGNPWIRTDQHTAWVNWDQISDDTTGALSGGERRYLAIARDLATGPLSEVDGGLDLTARELILGAVEHAGGAGASTYQVDHATGQVHTVDQPRHYPWP